MNGSLSTKRKHKPWSIIRISSWAPVLIIWSETMLDPGGQRAPTAVAYRECHQNKTKKTTKRHCKWQHLIILNAGWAVFNEIIMGPEHILKFSRVFLLYFCLFLCNVYSCSERSLKENLCLKKKNKKKPRKPPSFNYFEFLKIHSDQS